MKRLSVFILGLCLLPVAWAGDVPGLVVKQSPHSAAETLDRLENVLKKKGIGIVTRWNHAEKAAGVDIPLRDTELLLFGNPALGSHMFTSQQTAGIDLPMKALAWKDADGQVWLGYNDPQYIADRHGISNRSEIIAKMQGALDKLSDAAIAR
ncbi:MAG: DUF302 domain-containing protein [Thiohalophilus sp.]|uniref:DUF302 domain-containing protein n=1 Tax=Thiohalophilus sp. TaxID=3028392 RepID=UPI002870301E|nr:DUF302 domain-containing protein [Thiohalophilus sp.]MDR9436875.1 DUF302 domain-containing protein [Thiohalophilus sp.]